MTKESEPHLARGSLAFLANSFRSSLSALVLARSIHIATSVAATCGGRRSLPEDNAKKIAKTRAAVARFFDYYRK